LIAHFKRKKDGDSARSDNLSTGKQPHRRKFRAIKGPKRLLWEHRGINSELLSAPTSGEQNYGEKEHTINAGKRARAPILKGYAMPPGKPGQFSRNNKPRSRLPVTNVFSGMPPAAGLHL